jgi:hypothetical protein
VTHLSDEDLILHYYRDPECRGRVEAHLVRCSGCASAYRELAAALALIPEIEVPARNERYGLEVWQRIRSRLPERAGGPAFGWVDWRLPAAAVAIVLLIVAAVWSVGRLAGSTAVERAAGEPVPGDPGREQVLDSRRTLLLSVADHLERSDRVLTDIMNAPAGMDLSVEQGWAEDLLWTGRIYRQNALDANEQSVAAVLDDLERTLLDIVHAPPQLTDAQLDAVRERMDAGALLFKVRVLHDDLTQSGAPAARNIGGGVEAGVPTAPTVRGGVEVS